MAEYKGKTYVNLDNQNMEEILESIYNRIQERPDLEESEVTDVFTDNDFFEELGYEGIPIDVRSENHIVGGDRPDYFAKDKYGNVIFVVEFKKPSRSEDLASHKNQLWEQYVKPMKADYGVLTNGEEIILYERGRRNRSNRIFRKRLDQLSVDNIENLKQLRKPKLEFKSKESVSKYFSEIDPVSVGETVDGENVGQKEFFDTFRLERGTIFYQMLEKTFNLIDHYVEEGEPGNFPKDAFEFWEQYYASDPSWWDIPEEWREIAGSSDNQQKVMFAVETVQSLLGRLMLAKACEDYDFPNVQVSRIIEEETVDFRGEIPEVAYILTGRELMNRMRQELVESIFEQDIYYWWNTAAEDLEDMSPREMKESDWDSELEEFSDSLVEFIIAISRFDFSDIQGDPLGELYQQYFDPKTRRALGEFYTPPSITEYILDSVDYQRNIQHKRLIDPACGSGTFLVSALKQYKQDVNGDTDWATALQNLCEESRIVGLDIHPFAVVLAQIRFMLEILPEYKEAVEQEPNLVLKRLPIYRTDSLIDESETEEGMQQTLGASYGEGMVEFTMPLPIRKGSGFESMNFEFPQFGQVQSDTAGEISSRQQYFSALAAVFDAVKDLAEERQYSVDQDELSPYFRDYFSPPTDIDQIASEFVETANGFLDTVRELREEYNDGRLLKLIEDVVLGSTLKNDIDYHYVVGNPPWVSKHSRYTDDEQERRMKQLFYSAWKETDMYMQFMERGLQMLGQGGHLGFIVSNRFFKNKGAKEIRGLLAKNRIHEVVDFTDYQLFEGATNYSAIINVEKKVDNDDWDSFIEDGEFEDRYDIETTRVRDWGGTIPDLVEQIESREAANSIDFFEIDSNRFQERVQIQSGRVNREDVSERFTTTDQEIQLSKQLPLVDVWPVAPKEEYELLDGIEGGMEMRLGDKPVVRDNTVEQDGNLVGDDIRVGVQTNGDGVYVVKPEVGIAKEKLRELSTITISPGAIDKNYTVETDLLKVDITGEDAARWLPDWSNRLVFIPYVQGEERARLIRPKELASEYPKTWDYFTSPEVIRTLSEESRERNGLHARLAAEFDLIDSKSSKSKYRQVTLSDSQYSELSQKLRENVDYLDRQDKELWWYSFVYRKNIESLPKPKVLTGNQAQYNKLSFDDEGIMAPHNARVYAILIEDEKKTAVAGVLNSAVTEFYHKQHARIHQGKAYSYIEDYTSKWPVVVPEGEEKGQLEGLVEDILRLKDLEIKIPQFPDPYIAEAREEGEEFVDISYTPSNTYTAEPDIQTDLHEGFGIILDDGGINEGIIDTRSKAEYVREMLVGRKLEGNQTVTIPVPMDDRVAVDALKELEEDREVLEENNIGELERKIDEIVFDLYGIESDKNREMIRRYNTQYRKVRPIDPKSE